MNPYTLASDIRAYIDVPAPLNTPHARRHMQAAYLNAEIVIYTAALRYATDESSRRFFAACLTVARGTLDIESGKKHTPTVKQLEDTLTGLFYAASVTRREMQCAHGTDADTWQGVVESRGYRLWSASIDARLQTA